MKNSSLSCLDRNCGIMPCTKLTHEITVSITELLTVLVKILGICQFISKSLNTKGRRITKKATMYRSNPELSKLCLRMAKGSCYECTSRVYVSCIEFCGKWFVSNIIPSTTNECVTLKLQLTTVKLILRGA